MERGKEEAFSFSSGSLVQFLYRWWRQLVTLCIIAFVFSSVASLMITDKYKSTVILFPATTNSISKALISGANDVLVFGQEEDAEQTLQMLNSDQIRNAVCRKYDLMKHYGIDQNDPYKRTLLYEEYNSNISYRRNQYMAVEINVLDISRDTSALIANDIARLLDSTKARLQHSRAKKALEIVEAEYEVKKKEVERLQDSLKKINMMGINDYESMSEVTNEQYTIALAKGDEKALSKLREEKRILGEFGAAYIATRDNLAAQQVHFNNLKQRYDEARVDVAKSLPASFVVNSASPPEKKSYPVRWLIVVVSVISTLILGMLTLMLYDHFTSLKTSSKITELQKETTNPLS